MKAKTWQKRIKEACISAGTYKPYFDSVIESLSRIMENRDLAAEQFEDSGSKAVVEHYTKTGEVNVAKNPALVIILDCEAQALNYWRELGLTSKSWKAIQKGELAPQTTPDLSGVLSGLGL